MQATVFFIWLVLVGHLFDEGYPLLACFLGLFGCSELYDEAYRSHREAWKSDFKKRLDSGQIDLDTERFPLTYEGQHDLVLRKRIRHAKRKDWAEWREAHNVLRWPYRIGLLLGGSTFAVVFLSTLLSEF